MLVCSCYGQTQKKTKPPPKKNPNPPNPTPNPPTCGKLIDTRKGVEITEEIGGDKRPHKIETGKLIKKGWLRKRGVSSFLVRKKFIRGGTCLFGGWGPPWLHSLGK